MGWTVGDVHALDADYYDVLLDELNKEANAKKDQPEWP